MRKAFLLGGVALLIATVATASQPSRGDGPALRSDSEPSHQYQMVADGVAQVTTLSGLVQTVRADGAISLEDLGDTPILRHQWEESQRGIEGTRGLDGDLVSANGAIGRFADTVGTKYDVPTIASAETMVEVLKKTTVWVDTPDVMVFLNGVVLPGMDRRQPGWDSRQSMMSGTSPDGPVWADGSIDND